MKTPRSGERNCSAAIKIAVHGLLRLVNDGRHGRSVVSLCYLTVERRGIYDKDFAVHSGATLPARQRG
jgi:hypothetical protein